MKTRIVESFGVPKLVVGPSLKTYGNCHGAKMFENGMVAVLDGSDGVSVYRNAEDPPIISGYADVYMYQELNVCLKIKDGIWFLVSRDAFFINSPTTPYLYDDISRFIVAKGSDIKVKNGIVALKSLDENVGWEFYSLNYEITKLPIVCKTELGDFDEYVGQLYYSYVLSVINDDVEKPTVLYAMSDYGKGIINSVEAENYAFIEFKPKSNFVVSDGSINSYKNDTGYHISVRDEDAKLQLYDCRLYLRQKDCDEIVMISYNVYFVRRGKEWTLYGADNKVIQSGLINLKFYGKMFASRIKGNDGFLLQGHITEKVIMLGISNDKTVLINYLGEVLETDKAMTRIEMI